MPAPKKVSTEEVLDALRKRDTRQRPAVTASHVADGFDVSTRTIKRRLTELVVEGEVSCVKYANVTVYWSNAVASCAECGADCEDLDGNDMRCYQCGSFFTQTITPDGMTEEMEEIQRATAQAIYWQTLPAALKSLVTTLAGLLAPLRSEGNNEYRPGMLHYDLKKEEVNVEPDKPTAETDDEDDERRLGIGFRGDGLGLSKQYNRRGRPD
jgi:Zn finger protein HypA/HybF involved in hydrogenase expression